MKKPPIYTRDDFNFWTSIRTRWGDMDGLRHINHAAYLSYMESARLDFYQYLGYEYTRWDMEVSTILAGMKIDYFQQTEHPATFDIGQSITRVGNTSFDIATAVFIKEDLIPVVQGLFTLVAFDYNSNKSILVPLTFRQALEK
ncbi:MAG: thioesterase family protein [Candidatus Marinimicrobia bacterium]|nr:thioesterase family protein [Candidatus Neomarinimicrobiota bacterium]